MEFQRKNRVWILVAHESGARIFLREKPGSSLELLEQIEHPIGRAKNGQLQSDRAGREEGWGSSAQHYGMSQQVSATEKNALDFARELSSRLDQGLDQSRFDYLILVAGAKLLGLIQGVLSPRTAKKVIATESKNLSWIQSQGVPKHLVLLLENWDRQHGLISA